MSKKYVYIVTHSSGNRAKTEPIGTILVNKKNVGKWKCWQFYNLDTGKETGTITGYLIANGVDDDEYKEIINALKVIK